MLPTRTIEPLQAQYKAQAPIPSKHQEKVAADNLLALA